MKPLWKRILVPVGFSLSSEKALKTAIEIGIRNGRAVLLQELEQGKRVLVISASIHDELSDREWDLASAHYVLAARPQTVGQL